MGERRGGEAESSVDDVIVSWFFWLFICLKIQWIYIWFQSNEIQAFRSVVFHKLGCVSLITTSLTSLEYIIVCHKGFFTLALIELIQIEVKELISLSFCFAQVSYQFSREFLDMVTLLRIQQTAYAQISYFWRCWFLNSSAMLFTLNSVTRWKSPCIYQFELRHYTYIHFVWLVFPIDFFNFFELRFGHLTLDSRC